MRCTKPQGLHAHKSAPAGHDDGGGHSRAGVVSETTLAVLDKERATLNGQAGVVGLHRDDAGLNRKTRAPESVGLCIGDSVDGMRSGLGCQPRLRRWAEPLMPPQVALKRRARIWPYGRRGVGLIGPERRRFAFADRSDDRRRVEWITSWTPHCLPVCFLVRQENRIVVHVSIPDILLD
jgi:hypothetical protein